MKTYYVDGGILVTTPFFKYAGGGAGFGREALPGSELIPPNEKLPSGEEYLLIDDKNPQTMFAKYYAKTFFTTGYSWAPLFHKSYDDDYSELCDRIHDAREFLKISEGTETSSDALNLLLRHSFLIVLSALDTFIADTVLTRITNDEDSFYFLARHINDFKGCETDIDKGRYGKAEQKVIEYVLNHSYLNKETIKETYHLLFGFSVTVGEGMKDLFKQRHLIAHRGGRKKDGSYVIYTEEDIETTISKVNTFAKAILKKINTWESSRIKPSGDEY